jgi:hypothetical protein
MRYAVACGLATSDPTASLRGALIAGTKKSFAAVTEPEKLGALLRVLPPSWRTSRSGVGGIRSEKCTLAVAG